MNFGKLMKGSLLLLAAGMLTGCCCTQCEPAKDPNYTGMLGPDNFWRPRENITFYLYDQKGGGFDVTVAVRDINTYTEGHRPVYIFLVDPAGNIVDRKFVKDDGIVKNDYKHKDGLNDIWMDIRYREYHRAFSPKGVPPGKSRSPKLANPKMVKPAVVTLKAPAKSSKGVYRLAVGGSWDHFLTVTPSRRLLEGVHPGQCGLYLHGTQFEKGAYMYLPADTKLLFFGVTEEVRPFTTTVETPFGKILPKDGYITTLTVPQAPQNKVIRISAKVKNPGTMLHIMGAPMILCESAEAAKAFANFEDPAVTRLKKVKAKNKEEQQTLDRLCQFGPCFGFRDYREKPIDPKKWNPGLGIRSNWWDFGDGWFNYEKLSPEYKADAVKLMEQWIAFRYVMEVGMCPNQWGKITEQMANMYKYTKSPTIKEAVIFNAKRMCTMGSVGRSNPDKDTFLSGYEADNGMTRCGIMAEALGHDAEYNLETDVHLSNIYSIVQVPEILKYMDYYYEFKTHLTLPKQAVKPASTFSHTVSPTDTNFRTRYYTHKTNNLACTAGKYSDLWGNAVRKKPNTWPAMEKGPFVRVMDQRYAFINTGKYYAVVYLAHNFPQWQNYGCTKEEKNTVKITGFTGAGYGGWQAPVSKPGGISAIWVPGCGPVMAASNHNAMFSNILWGKVTTQLPPSDKNVDRYMTMDAQTPCVRTFDAEKKVSVSTGSLSRANLDYKREVKFKEDKIEVKITLTALKNTFLKELYETIPLYAENRTLKADGNEIKFPKPVQTPSHQFLTSMEGYSGVPPFRAKKLELYSANGKGMDVEFGSTQEMVLTQVMKYRGDVAAAVSGVSVKLPTTFRKGQKYVFEYTLKIR